MFSLTEDPRFGNAIYRSLEKHGYARIGSGNFTLVYARPGSKSVIRIGGRSDAWESFARMVLKSNNTHFPKIERIGTNGNFLIARVERLYPISPEAFISENIPMLCFIVRFITNRFDQGVYVPNGRHDWEYTALRTCFAKEAGIKKKRNKLQHQQDEVLFRNWVDSKIGDCPPLLMSALVNIKDVPAKRFAQPKGFDFKPENFMKREDGTLVISDPIW